MSGAGSATTAPGPAGLSIHTESILCMVCSKRGVMDYSGFFGGRAPRGGASRGIARAGPPEVALGRFPGVELAHLVDGVDR